MSSLSPCSNEAEQGVLGCVLLDAERCLSVLRKEGIGPRHFFDLRHAEILKTIIGALRAGAPITDLALWPLIQKAEINIDLNYLSSLRDGVPSSQNLGYYLPLLKEAFTRRKIIEFAGKAITIASDREQSLEVVNDTLEQLSRIARPGIPGELPNITDAWSLSSTPPPKPTELVYGLLHKGSKMVLGGGSKSYKTWTLIDLALSVSHGEPWLGFKTAKGRVLYLNLELQDWSFSERLKEVARAKNLAFQNGVLDAWNLRGYSAPYDSLLPKIRDRVKDGNYSMIVLDPVTKSLEIRTKTQLAILVAS